MRPMLAAKATEEELKTLFRGGQILWVSPKLDGVRALVKDGILYSRTMKPIRNFHTQSLFRHLEGFDGELIVGEPNNSNCMQVTTSGVMSYAGEPDVSYYVFDQWNSSKLFFDRYPWGYSYPKVIAVPQIPVSSYDDMLALEEAYLSEGYEGLILRDNCPYKQGRSTLRERGMVKVKRFIDGEAVIVGFEQLYSNENVATLDERGYTKRSSAQDGKVAKDMLGAFVVCNESGTFNIGTGLTEAMRVEFWKNKDMLRGKLVKFKSFPVGVKDLPRHPVFLGFRHEDDV